MNSLWLERFSSYRVSPLAISSAKVLLQIKDARRANILGLYKRSISEKSYISCETLEEVFLCEARNAKQFWMTYAKLLPPWCAGFARRPQAADVVNKLLDVGYHHLATIVEKIFSERDISLSLGLIHRAQDASSKPLVYDVMELFRADMVDLTLLHYLRLKKKPIINPAEHIWTFFA